MGYHRLFSGHGRGFVSHDEYTLSHAVQSQNHPKIIAALEAGQDPGCWCLVQNTGRNEPVLLAAAAAGYCHSVHLLLNAFADPNSMGHDGRSAAHVAVLANSPLTMHLLIHSVADIHVQDRHVEKPLHYAADLENVVLVKQTLWPPTLTMKFLCSEHVSQIPGLRSWMAAGKACPM